MPEKTPRMIRFIDSQYNDKFYIPDGARIHIELPDRNWSAKCEFIDPYHTEIGGNIFHICEFAELLEKRGGTCRPEQVLVGDKFTWLVGNRHWMSMEKQGDKWQYAVFDNQNRFDSSSYVMADPMKTPNQARDEILHIIGKGDRNLYPVPYRGLESPDRLPTYKPSLQQKMAAAKLRVAAQPKMTPKTPRMER